jgi:hypothetical protein
LSSAGPVSYAVAMHALWAVLGNGSFCIVSSLCHEYARSHPSISKQLYHYCTLAHTKIIYLHIPFVQTPLIPLPQQQAHEGWNKPVVKVFFLTFCWQCIVLWFLVNDQRDAQFFIVYLFLYLTLYMFRVHRAHHQERQIVSIKPLVTVTLCRWPCRVQAGRPAQDTATDSYQRLYWHNLSPLMMSTMCSKHVES